MIKIIKYRLILLILIVIVQMLACDSETKSDNDNQKKTNKNQTEETVSGKAGTGAISKSIGEFVNKKKNIELTVYPSRADGLYDPAEMISLKVVIYSPRHLAFQTYIDSTDENYSDIEFADILIGSKEKPWEENLTLLAVNDAGEDTVLFSAFSFERIKVINIGKGDMGSTRLLIVPGYFSQSGKLKFYLSYNDKNIDEKLIAKTTIRLENNLADSLQRIVSTIEYLQATGDKQKALDIATASVVKWPESYHARVLLGLAYEENDNLEEALRAYSIGLGLFKDDDPDYITDYPDNLWIKIKEIEAQLDGKQ